MNRRFLSLLLLFGLLGSGGELWAQGRWRDLPPEERRQMRQQMREHWQQESTLRQEAPSRWRDVPPEDRRRMREEMRDQREWQELRNERGRGWRNE